MTIPTQKKAVIDIGTNSIKLCIAEGVNSSDDYSVVYDENKTTRLGEGLGVNSELGAAPRERSIELIQRFVIKAHELGAAEIRAIGTAALRKAANAGDFCSKVKDSCGIDVEIISGEREAELTYNAAISAARGQDCIIFDIGGGSVEFIYSRNNKVYNRFSIDFGVLNIKDKYFSKEPMEDESLRKTCHEISNDLYNGGLVIPSYKFTLIGIGGTVVTMASVKLALTEFHANMANGTVLNISDIESQIRQYQNSTLEERIKIQGLFTGREDIILAGACFVKTIMESLFASSIIVSTNGLRHAILALMFRK
ncbi:MAG: Ppx/GppA family phosphatase [Synergistaceae bacterium]|nr:Ppx/GppA family phosphatase [Synergistaceae bacterium]